MNQGIPVLLTRVKTSDGIFLEGIIVKPKRKSKTALIWVHGLGSRFSSGQALVKELSTLLSKSGVGYFKFNNRGHDEINRDGYGKKKYQGKAFEKFEDSIKDIRTVVREAKRIGFKKIILAGHSTGSNKALYYMYKTQDHSIRGLILTGALSDMSVWDTGELQDMRQALAVAKRLVKKNPDALLPQEYGIYTAKRYLSLYEARHAEDVFPYHNRKGSWKELKSIHVPIAVIIGSRDQYLDRPAQKLIEIFKKNAIHTKSFSGVVIQGANHGFYKKEKELAGVITSWVKKI